jgi:Protein of unknown function (DUF3179)
MASWRLQPVARAAFVIAIAMAPACDISDTSVHETPVQRVILKDQEGKWWDITQAVVRYGFDPNRFRYGLGPFTVTPIVLPEMAAPGDSGYPDPGAAFTVVGIGGTADPRAYRVEDMLDIEIVDDIVNGAPVAVIIRPFFPPPYAPSVYGRVLDGDTLTLSASGWVYDNESMLYDYESESMWYRLPGETALTCIAGPHFTATLPTRSATIGTWVSWASSHPASGFMLRPPGVAPPVDP